jgi:hypothetical protein
MTKTEGVVQQMASKTGGMTKRTERQTVRMVSGGLANGSTSGQNDNQAGLQTDRMKVGLISLRGGGYVQWRYSSTKYAVSRDSSTKYSGQSKHSFERKIFGQ